MIFKPCIDIHNGKVKQIIGSTLTDFEGAQENFIADKDAVWFASYYAQYALSGGHIVMLNPPSHPQYEATKKAALSVLKAYPGVWQIGGGITPENASFFLEAGASHVIVTSYVFHNGRLDDERLKKITSSVGKEHLVLDVSCRNKEGRYTVVTDRWQHDSALSVTEQTLDRLSASCDAFLVHAADAEGKRMGIELPLVKLLGDWGRHPVTYAGGIRDAGDIEMVREAGQGKVDVTVGSALTLFGGSLSIDDVIAACAP